MSDLIERQAAIDALDKRFDSIPMEQTAEILQLRKDLRELPSAQPERLTDDDFETIRIHLNAFKESLCNQGRWEEARDYERLIDRLRKHNIYGVVYCSECDYELHTNNTNFCPNCGAKMEVEHEA